MNRNLLGVGISMVRQLAATAAANQPATQQATTAASNATTAANTATQAAQQAQQAATAAGQLAQQALTNNATLTDTVAALNKLSSDYLTAVKASQEDRTALHAQLNELAGKAAALEARKTTIALGRAVTPALGVLGSTADITVTLTRAMPSANYQVDVLPVAALLGKTTFTIKAQTTTTVTVTVKATAVLVAGSLDLIAWAHQ